MLSPIELGELLAGTGFGAGCYAFARRYGGSTALAELERSNRVLDRRVRELEDENKTLRADVAKLTASRDVAIVIQPVLAALTTHEELASRRSEATLHVLEMIAAKLGAEAA